MNTYAIEFFSNCPNNGVRVKYHLRIETTNMIRVEDIVTEAERVEDGTLFHEEIAERLALALPGRQTLTAHHHGVDIITVRGAADSALVAERSHG